MNTMPHAGQMKRPLTIGLVNNMSPSAMASTKAQFARLLEATGHPAELVCFTMHSPQYEHYGHLPIAALGEHGVDAIIVTGMEVTTSDLRDEWVWPGFTRLHDWCDQESIPAIWSCLAAHAAVLHRDNIPRQRLGAKLSGLFGCQRASMPHRLTQDLPPRWNCPHSRYNGLSRGMLTAHGYSVLSEGAAVGVDIFTHTDQPASFYFQGHPEYQAGTLLQEFLRDLRRYGAGEMPACPSVPAYYLDAGTEQALSALRVQALAGHDVLQAARDVAQQAVFLRDWAGPAVQLYANWLGIVADHAMRRPDWSLTLEAAPQPGAAAP
jgi:homoserine O-succinyltransferase/O-acetyltransferase